MKECSAPRIYACMVLSRTSAVGKPTRRSCGEPPPWPRSLKQQYHHCWIECLQDQARTIYGYQMSIKSPNDVQASTWATTRLVTSVFPGGCAGNMFILRNASPPPLTTAALCSHTKSIVPSLRPSGVQESWSQANSNPPTPYLPAGAPQV